MPHGAPRPLQLARRRPIVVLVPLVVLFVASGLVQAWRDSPTVDEAVDIASGVTSLVRHDLRLNPEHGVLTHVLPALPALLAHPVVPRGPAYASGEWFDHTDDFMRANDAAGRLHRVVFLSRLVPLAEAVFVAFLIYALGARLFGPWAGVLSATLWLTTPVFVGFGHIASLDVAFTLATLAVSLALLRFVEAPSNGRAAVLGAAVCASLLVRHLALVLAAVALVVVLVQGWSRARRATFRHAAIVALTSWAGVWVVFRVLSLPPSGPSGARLGTIISAGRSDSLITRLVLAVPWPKEWAAGMAYLVLSSASKPAYLLGHAWNGGRWWYFLAVVPVKVPLVALAAVIGGMFGWRRVPRPSRRHALLVVAAPAIALYVAVAIQPLDLGLRYAFPSLALAFVAGGPVVFLGSTAFKRAGAAALVVTQLAAMVAAYPHAMAWTPPPFQSGYRWATDSNIDYGQDYGRVAEWAAGKQPFVALLKPRGVDDPPGSRPLLDADGSHPERVSGWVAVSATRLMALDRDALSWLRAYCPVGDIGGSVLLYRFDEPIDDRPGPTMPVGPCTGDLSRRTG